MTIYTDSRFGMPSLKTVVTIVVAFFYSTCVLGQDAARSAEERRWPIPQQTELNSAARSIESIFAKQIASAKLPHQKAALARSLLATAKTTSDDPASQFVLLQQAIVHGTDAGSVSIAYQAIDLMNSTFESVLPLKEKAKVCKRTSSTAFPLTTAKEITERTVDDVTAAIDTDGFEEALVFVEAGLAAYKRQNAATAVSELEALRDDIRLLSEQFSIYQAALGRINMRSEALEDHRTVGYYFALSKHDWINAEQHLAVAGEMDLRSLVVKEFMQPSDTASQVQLADAWWEFSESLPRVRQLQARACASFWYVANSGNVEGLTGRKVNDRLSAMTAFWKSRRTVKKTKIEPVPDGKEEPPPSPKVTNLMELLADPRKHAKRGTWQLVDGELTPTASRGILSVPGTPSDSYAFTFDLFRARGNEVVLLTLPVAKRQVYVELSCQGGRRNAMSFIKGRHSDNNGTASDTSLIKNGEWNDIAVEVVINGDDCDIKCAINDRVAVQWHGEWRDLGIDGNWGPASDGQIGLASVDPGVKFRKLILKEFPKRTAGRRAEVEAIRMNK